MQLTTAQLEAFKSWLSKCGAEVLIPLNPGDILHVAIRGASLTLHQRTSGHQRWPGALLDIYTCFATGRDVNLARPVAVSKSKEMSGNARRSRVLWLAARDGWTCWYCGCDLQPLGTSGPYAQVTLEELCPRQIGGPKHIGNQVLSCHPCNQEANALAVAEKVLMRERLRFGGVADRAIGLGGACPVSRETMRPTSEMTPVAAAANDQAQNQNSKNAVDSNDFFALTEGDFLL